MTSHKSLAKRTAGFTIVELLIVIVVIGILATITIVAYNGIQQRSKNTQTISAITTWSKALAMYLADQGQLPTQSSCLGTNYNQRVDDNPNSEGRCRRDNPTSSGITSNPTFLSAMQPYINSNPEPTTSVVNKVSDDYWFRGAYYYAAATKRIDYVLDGVVDCPQISGLEISSRGTSGNTTRCHTIVSGQN